MDVRLDLTLTASEGLLRRDRAGMRHFNTSSTWLRPKALHVHV